MRGYCSAKHPAIRAVPALILCTVAACTSASQQITAPGSGRCAATLAASTTEFGAEGGSGRLTVATARDCRWQATTDAGWISVTSPGEAQGDGTAAFTVAALADPVARSASLAVGDDHVTISQRAAACRYRLSSVELSLPAAGGSSEIDVTASSSLCEWTVQSTADWLAIPSGQRYKGNARVALQAAAWAGPARRADVTIADQRIALTQSTGCVFILTPASASVPQSAGSGSLSVHAAPGCAWSAASVLPWVAITRGSAGLGPGSAEFTFSANTGPARAGTLTIATRAFAISQASGCEYLLDPGSWTFTAPGGSGTVTVQTGGSCPWAASSEVSWMSISAGHSATGSGVVYMSIAPNSGPQRSGGIRIAGVRFTATQLSGCTYNINPNSWTFPPQGQPGWVAVTTGPDCPWTVASQAEWMTFSAGTSFVGPGGVWFTVAPNPSPPRTGTLTVAGQTFQAVQLGSPTN
jgi:hypothetical protein